MTDRTIIPLNIDKFLKECGVEGRLIRSIASSSGGKDYFIVKLKDSNLIQRYMIIIREAILGLVTPKTNILRYENSLENCETFLAGK